MLENVGAGKLKKKHYSREEKNKYYELWKMSNLSQLKFSEENNIAVQTFSRWVKEIEKSSPSKLSFIPLERIAEKTVCKQSLEIQLSSGIICRFSEISDVLQVSRLIQGLHHAFITHSK